MTAQEQLIHESAYETARDMYKDQIAELQRLADERGRKVLELEAKLRESEAAAAVMRECLTRVCENIYRDSEADLYDSVKDAKEALKSTAGTATTITKYDRPARLPPLRPPRRPHHAGPGADVGVGVVPSAGSLDL